MFIALIPDQVAKFWDIIKYSIEESLPPTAGRNEDRMNRILSSALSGKTTVWISYTRKDDQIRINGIAVTRILLDDISYTRNLLIYCVYGYDNTEKNMWVEGLTSLAKYAREKNCSQIIAYTQLPKIAELAKKFKANTSYTFISFDVEDYLKI